MRNTLPLIILFIFIIIFFFRLFYPVLSIFMIPDFGQSDVLHLNLPLKYLLSSSLKEGVWPLWTPDLANGFPILAEGQTGTFYIPNLLFFRFLPLVLAYNLNLVLSFFLSGLGVYLFCRKLQLSAIGSFFGAFIFTFCGFLSVHLNHFNLIQAASLLPLVFWSALILWEKPSFNLAVLLAFLLSEQIFTGHFYIVFITLVGMAIFLLGMSSRAKRGDPYKLEKIASPAKRDRNDNKIRLFFLSISLIIAFLFSAIQLLPTIELWKLSQRAGGLDFAAVTDYPYPFRHLVTFIFPYFFGSPANGSYPAFNQDWGIFWENTAYVGMFPLLLVFASFKLFRKKTVKIFLLMTGLSILLVLGKNSPMYFIFTFFPFNLFRVPSKYLLLSVFSLSLLAAFSSDKLFKKFLGQSRVITFIFGGLVLLLIVVDEYKFSYNYPPQTPQALWTSAPESVKLLPTGTRISSTLAPFAWNEVFKTKGWQDFTPFEYFKNFLYPNYNVFYGVKSADINTGGLMPRRATFLKSMLSEIDLDENSKTASLSASYANTINLLGINFLISPFEIINKQLVLEKTINPSSAFLKPVLIYKNLKARPRSYLAYFTQKLDTLQEFQSKMADKSFDDNLILLEDDMPLTNNPPKKIAGVQITGESSQNLTISAASDSDAILVLSDSFYPGWTAYLDGKKTKIFPVNLVQKGILFPKGKHEVKFVFKSVPFETGKNITVVSIFIISSAVFVSSLRLPRKGF